MKKTIIALLGIILISLCVYIYNYKFHREIDTEIELAMLWQKIEGKGDKDISEYDLDWSFVAEKESVDRYIINYFINGKAFSVKGVGSTNEWNDSVGIYADGGGVISFVKGDCTDSAGNTHEMHVEIQGLDGGGLESFSAIGCADVLIK
jgi:hypothetical protein